MKEKLYYRKDIMKKYHISRSVIENYEHLGLVKATKKDKMGYLLYDEKAINQVGQIRFLQLLKIDLRQIKDILNDSKQEKAIINKQINILKLSSLKITVLPLLNSSSQPLMYPNKSLPLVKKLLVHPT